jgi:hypothetical protein
MQDLTFCYVYGIIFKPHIYGSTSPELSFGTVHSEIKLKAGAY